ncbi:MAG: hypothetical protein ACKO7D_03535 [Bacteroidota bacterium]
MRKTFFLLLVLPLFLTSCIEIIDDLSINADGSGTFKYTINLSSSKLKVNTMLKLDSLNGKKMLKLPEIKAKINQFKSNLASQSGISNVKFEMNDAEFIGKFSCDFTDVGKLQDAIKNSLASMDADIKSSADFSFNWISWNGSKLERSIPDFSQKQFKDLKQEDIDLLKTGNYTVISRFYKPVEKYDNANAIISKSRTAVMLKANAYSLTKNSKILENTIYLNQK